MSGEWWVLNRGARTSHYLNDDGTTLCGRRLGLESEGGRPERLVARVRGRIRCQVCSRKSAAAPPDPKETQ